MATKHAIFLRGDGLYLRPLEKRDAKRMQRWINDPATRKWLGVTTPVTLDQEVGFLEGISKRESDIILAIVLSKGDKHIGSIGLHAIDYQSGRAATGMVIGNQSYRGKGYGPKAKALLLEYAFNTLALRMVTAITIGGNDASHRSILKSGYTHEATLRDRYFRDGTYHTERHYSITKEEWEKMYRP